jgi:excisionase family DNA binding protein
MKDLEDLITQAEAARIRGVTRTAIAGLIARGNLSVVEIGGQKFLRRAEVEKYKPQAAGRPATKDKMPTKATKKKSSRPAK